MTTHFNNLQQEVLILSESDHWNEAVTEWELDRFDEDEKAETDCVCGKKNIRYLHRIVNIHNGNKLEWIGSECIKKFDRTDFDALLSVESKLLKISNAIRAVDEALLNSSFFSKKLIDCFYNNNVFQANEYNSYDASNDHKFLLAMFNKRTEKT